MPYKRPKMNELLDYTQTMEDLYEAIEFLGLQIQVRNDEKNYKNYLRNIKNNFSKLENEMGVNGDL